MVATRDLVLAALLAPLRPPTRTAVVLSVAVVLAETVGLVVRLRCAGPACGDWAARLDMDALGSVPRALITLVLAAGALTCLRGVRRAGRDGAAVWWTVLALGLAVLAMAKHTSVHSVLEGLLADVLPAADVQLLFVVVTAVGLVVVTVTGARVRRESRAAVTTWLVLYAAASVGLAAVTLLVGHLGATAAGLATWVEESAEGVSAVGLLAVLVREVAAVSRRVAAAPAPESSTEPQ